MLLICWFFENSLKINVLFIVFIYGCSVQEPTLSAAAVMKFDTIRIMILWLDVCVSAYVCERDAMHLASVCQVISVYKLEKN